MKKAVIPAAVGVDIGCGMMASKTSLTLHDLPENLKKLRSDIERSVPHGRSLGKKMKSDVGSWDSRTLPEHFENHFKCVNDWFDRYRNDYGRISRRMIRRHPISRLGNLGTENHFIELCLDENDHVWIMLHSGSRGIGNAVGTYFIDKAQRRWENNWVLFPTKIVHI